MGWLPSMLTSVEVKLLPFGLLLFPQYLIFAIWKKSTVLQDNLPFSCCGLPTATASLLPCSSALLVDTSAEHHLHINPKSPSTKAVITPHPGTLSLSSSFLGLGQKNFSHLGMFSFLHVINITVNKFCLHADTAGSHAALAPRILIHAGPSTH